MNYEQMWRILSAGGVKLIDAAPNYDQGRAETFVGQLELGLSTELSTKVGFTGGDPPVLRDLAAGKRHCLSREYVLSRVEQSRRALGLGDRPIDTIFIHNPEQLILDGATSVEFCNALREALGAIETLIESGSAKTFGISSWSIPNKWASLSAIFDIVDQLDLAPLWSTYMYPVNVLKRELLLKALHQDDDFKILREANIRLFASSPLAAGRASDLLGPIFSQYFNGVSDSLDQAIALAKANALSAIPIVGFRTLSQCQSITRFSSIEGLDDSSLQSVLNLLDEAGGVEGDV